MMTEHADRTASIEMRLVRRNDKRPTSMLSLAWREIDAFLAPDGARQGAEWLPLGDERSSARKAE